MRDGRVPGKVSPRSMTTERQIAIKLPHGRKLRKMGLVFRKKVTNFEQRF